METHLEQRKNRRYEAKLAVHAEFEAVPGVIKGLTRNISSTGIYFSIPRTEAAQVGSKVSLEILVPEDFVFANGKMKGTIFRIRAAATVVRLLNDAQLDVTRVAARFSSYRFVREEGESSEHLVPTHDKVLLEHSFPDSDAVGNSPTDLASK
jgi:cation transport regulator ChaC